MSDILSNMKAVITLDASGMSVGAQQAQGVLQGLVTVAQSSFYGLNQVGIGLKQVGDALLGVVGGFASAAEAYQTAAAQISAITYDNTKSLQQNVAAGSAQESQIRDTAVALKQPITAFNDLNTTVATFGYRGKDITTVSTAIQELATTSGASASSVAVPFSRLADLFGVTADKSLNLASAVKAAAVETVGGTAAFLTMADRGGALGQSIGLSVTQTLALTAVMANLDGRVRGMAGTFQLFTVGFVDAMAQGGTKLKDIAAISGQTGEQFKAAFQADPGGTLTAWLANLEKAKQSGQNIIPVLTDIGAKSGQTATGILDLAQAQTASAVNGKTYTDTLTGINKAYGDSTTLTNSYKAATDTVAGAIVSFKDKLVQLETSFGESGLLPILKVGYTVLGALADIFKMLPEPMKAVIVVLTLLMGVLTMIGGVVLLFGVRALQMISALQAMYAAHQRTTVAAQEHALSIDEVTIAMEALERATANLAAAQAAEDEALTKVSTGAMGDTEAMDALALATANVRTATEALAVAEEGVVVALVDTDSALIATDGAVVTTTGLIGTLTTVLGVVAIAFFVWEQAQAHARAETEKATKAAKDFADQWAKQQPTGSTDANSQAAHATELELQKLQKELDTTQTTGAKLWDAFGVGTKDPQTHVKELRAEIANLQGQMDGYGTTTANANQIATDMGISVQAVFDLAAKKGVVLSGVLADVKTALGDTKTAASGSGTIGPTQADLDATNKAVQDYAKELVIVGEDTNRVADATISYNAALQTQADLAQKVVEATLAVTVARNTATEAGLSEKIAQFDADHAAEDQARALVTAQNAVADAQIKIETDTEAVATAQAALQKLNGIDYWISLQQAINAVADAQISLRDAQTKSADAVWQLNKVVEEGGSPADIAKAQLDLATAQQKVTDVTTNQAAAQQKVNNMPADHARQVAAANDALEASQITLTRSGEALAAVQEALARQQLISADNIGVIKAHDALVTAKDNVLKADNGIIDAERTLAKLQDGSAQRAASAAHLALTQALYQEAEAQTRVQVDLDASKGIIDGVGQKALILAHHLIDIGTAGHNPDLVTAGHFIINNVAGPLSVANAQAVILKQSLWDINTATLNANKAAQLGLSAGQMGIGQTGSVKGFGGGGIVTVDTPAMLHAPEVVIPLDNPALAMQWLSSSGLLNQFSSLPAAARPAGAAEITQLATSTVNNANGGAQNNYLTAITTADPREIVDQFMWQHAVSVRS